MVRNTAKYPLVLPINTNIRAALEVVGGLLTFVDGGKRGTLRQLVLADDGNIGAAFDIYFFDELPDAANTFADEVAFTPTSEFMSTCIGEYNLSAWKTLNTNKHVVIPNLEIDYNGNGITAGLYAYVVLNTGTPTWAVGDLRATAHTEDNE